jgi:hypothetical protein
MQSNSANNEPARGFPSEADQHLRRVFEGARDDLGLSQDQLGKMLGGITGRTYRNWMLFPTQLNADQLGKLTEALKLSAAVRASVWALSGRRTPLSSTGAEGPSRELRVYRHLINGSSHPTVVYDYAWDVVTANAAFYELFATVRSHATAMPTLNTVRYILFHPDAHVLLGGDHSAFHEYWLMPTLANFVAVSQQLPNDNRLQSIRSDIAASPNLRSALEQVPDWIRKYEGDVHVSSDPRPIWDPRRDVLDHVHVVTFSHQGYQPQTLNQAAFVFPQANGPSPVAAERQGDN